MSELRRTTASGTMIFLPADRVIVGPERYTAAEVAELSGVEMDFFTAARRAMGLPIPDPDEPVYTEGELDSARRTLVARKPASPTMTSSSCCACSAAASPRRPRPCGRYR